MSQKDIYDILRSVQNGDISVNEAADKLKMKPFDDIGYAKVDHHRQLRQGASEVIYGQGKTAQQIIGIAKSMLNVGQRSIMVTRIDRQTAAVISSELPLDYKENAQIGLIGEMPEPDGAGVIVVATGGTTDIPVAEEAAFTAEFLGNKVVRLYDVGVSGIHRLLSNLETLVSARAIVAVAGMEGALPAVISGLVDCPVIAVPTSIGYGAALGGVAALLSMLNSCASGTSVVNIDNGFGGGYLASMINHIGVNR